jgi:ribulose-phosphate 3-epimerase
MIVEPEKHIGAFMDAGGDIINVHVEASSHVHRVVQEVHARGKRAGVCLNPGTPVGAIEELLPVVDLVMAVNPGWSGQAFIASAIGKVSQVRQMIDEGRYKAEIEVDGGVKPGNAHACAAAGADVLVAASAIFNDQGTIGENVALLRAALASG